MNSHRKHVVTCFDHDVIKRECPRRDARFDSSPFNVRFSGNLNNIKVASTLEWMLLGIRLYSRMNCHVLVRREEAVNYVVYTLEAGTRRATSHIFEVQSSYMKGK